MRIYLFYAAFLPITVSSLCARPRDEQIAADSADSSSKTFQSLEMCTERCEINCTETTVIMIDEIEQEMFKCDRPKPVEELSLGQSAIVFFAENQFLLALLLIISITILGMLLATAVFGCCMCYKRLRSGKQPIDHTDTGLFGSTNEIDSQFYYYGDWEEGVEENDVYFSENPRR